MPHITVSFVEYNYLHITSPNPSPSSFTLKSPHSPSSFPLLSPSHLHSFPSPPNLPPPLFHPPLPANLPLPLSLPTSFPFTADILHNRQKTPIPSASFYCILAVVISVTPYKFVSRSLFICFPNHVLGSDFHSSA